MPVLNLNNQEEVREYENYIQTSPHGHMMQSIHWSKVKDNWDQDYVYVRNEEGAIEGALSILSVKNDGVHAFMYAPRGPVCDFSNLPLVERLLKEAESVAETRNAFLLRMDPEVLYNEELLMTYRNSGYHLRSRDLGVEKAFSNPRNHMILSLKGHTEESLMASFSAKERNKIRKTYKNGLKTVSYQADTEGFKEALDTFFALTKIMAERQGISHRPYSYFDRLLHAFEDARIFETRDLENEVLSSCILVTYNKKSFYIYAASSNSKRNLNASTQMNYEAILYALSQGMEEYDFGGIFSTDSSDGLFAFKYDFCGAKGHHEFIGELDIIYKKELYEEFTK